MKPLIGLTPTPQRIEQEHGTFRRHALSDNYSMAIEAAGGLPVMLPAHITDIPALLDRLDAVVITGGGDISPDRYGQHPHSKTDQIDVERDEFEIRILHEAIQRDLPILGICRGLQIFNVALGGTLHQDLDELFAGSEEHRQQSLKIHHTEVFQKAAIAPGTHRLREIIGADEIAINSFHHQGIEHLAPGLVSLASTSDGLVEAVELPTATFALAVQWHPEMLAPTRKEHAGIFEALIRAAESYQQRKEQNS